MDIDDTVSAKREEILRIAAKYGARNVRVFGSRVRGEARADSDVDFLVEMPTECSLLDLGRFVMDLQDVLKCQVDVVEPEGLHWFIRERVLNEAIPL
jgi:predicted nucleotidyltransferase